MVMVKRIVKWNNKESLPHHSKSFHHALSLMGKGENMFNVISNTAATDEATTAANEAAAVLMPQDGIDDIDDIEQVTINAATDTVAVVVWSESYPQLALKPGI